MSKACRLCNPFAILADPFADEESWIAANENLGESKTLCVTHPPKPIRVAVYAIRTVIVVFWIAVLPGLLDLFLRPSPTPSLFAHEQKIAAFVAFSLFLLISIMMNLLALNIQRGKEWARNGYTAFSAFHMLLVIPFLMRSAEIINPGGLLFFTEIALPTLVIYLLYTSNSEAWFDFVASARQALSGSRCLIHGSN